MKRLVLIVGILACLGLQSSLEARGAKNSYTKETTPDMSATKKVFLGWVDLPADQWNLWGYSGREDWAQTIKDINQEFQNSCQTRYLQGMVVTAAKDRSDENAAGNDLAIKFQDIHIDQKTYGISLSIHFIDPKTNSEIAVVPPHLYYEKRMWKFQSYMQEALEDVGKKMQVEITGSSKR